MVPEPSHGVGGVNGGGYIREIALLRDRVESFDEYPFSIPAVRHMGTLPLDEGVTIFVGENGSGKSTLIEAIAIRAGLNPEGGTRHFQHALRPSESKLHEALLLVRNPVRERTAFFLRAETMFNVATEVEKLNLQEYGWVDLHDRSHGEAFLWVVQNRLGPQGLYLFDEPESALSPQRQLSLLRLLRDLVRSGSQILMATHSPILMAYPGATIYACDEDGLSRVAYEETPHYVVTRAFLNRRERMLEDLFSDGDQDA